MTILQFFRTNIARKNCFENTQNFVDFKQFMKRKNMRENDNHAKIARLFSAKYYYRVCDVNHGTSLKDISSS